MKPTVLAPMLVVVIAFALVPAHAGAAATSFRPLARTAAKAHVGVRGVKRAKRQYRRGEVCASLKTLGRVVDGAKKHSRGGPVVRKARRLQRAIFRARAARHGRCGLAAPRFRVSGSAEPGVARLDNGHGTVTEFVEDELVVAGSEATAAKLAARWHGKVLRSSHGTHLLRVDASHAPTDDLAEDLIARNPGATGAFEVSSAAGLGLLAVAADAAAHGLRVAPNVLTQSAGVLDRSTAEAPVVPETTPDGWSPDAYSWWYTGDLGTGDAWRALEIAERTGNRVKLGVLDGGFATMGGADLSTAARGMDDVPNPVGCSGGSSCPWHGTNVASTAAALVDNGAGVAGSGGQVADVTMIQNGGNMFANIDAIYEALDAGVRIINISSGYELDAAIAFWNVPYEDATQTAFERGTLVVASAGNDGSDIDAEDCFVFCWEEEWKAPCENDAVICVGGIGSDRRRASGSNFGREWCGNAPDCDVDIFAPFTVWVGPDPVKPTPHRVSGTSFSSPYVAGVVATMMAASPSLDVWNVQRMLMESADASQDPSVSRVVNALAAVQSIGGRFGPSVRITQADDVPYGGLNMTTLKASADAVDRCDCTIAWSSDIDGPMGTGPSIEWTYMTPGERVITATLTDAGGATSTDTVKVNVTNDAPVAEITKPTHHATVYSGVPFKVQGLASDANEPGGLPCDSLRWDATLNHEEGCSATMKFYGTDKQEITLTAVDAHGVESTATISVYVASAPLNEEPKVTILSPDEGDEFDPDEIVTLEGYSTDPDAPTWSVRVGGTTTVIGTGDTVQWKPSDHVGPGCGNVDATLILSSTNTHGTGTDEIDVKVHYPVC